MFIANLVLIKNDIKLFIFRNKNEVHWPESKCTENMCLSGPDFDLSDNDWKVIDILALNEFDRAYNKLHDINDFLGELTIAGQIVDFVRSEKQPPEVGFAVNKLRREHKVGEFQKSPFLNRAIDFNRSKLTKQEEEVWTWINGKREKAM